MELQVCGYIIWLILVNPISLKFFFTQFFQNIFQSCTMIADAMFGRDQAKDLLQHLCASPSNAFVDVIQGSSSVEVRALGVTKVIIF